MPYPWAALDSVQVKINNSWYAATVDSVNGNDFRCSLAAPFPTLADVGLTHPRMPATTPFRDKVLAKYNPIIGAETIRDPI